MYPLNFPSGAIADCQYCSHPNRGFRHYSSSAAKLHQCVNAYINGHNHKVPVEQKMGFIT